MKQKELLTNTVAFYGLYENISGLQRLNEFSQNMPQGASI